MAPDYYSDSPNGTINHLTNCRPKCCLDSMLETWFLKKKHYFSVTNIEFHNSYISQRKSNCGPFFHFKLKNIRRRPQRLVFPSCPFDLKPRWGRNIHENIKLARYVARQCGDLVIEKCWRLGMKRISNEATRRPDWCEKCWCQFLFHQTHLKLGQIQLSLPFFGICRFKWPTTISSERSLSLSSPRDVSIWDTIFWDPLPPSCPLWLPSLAWFTKKNW